MVSNYVMEIVGLKEIGDSVPENDQILEAASRAINATLRKTRTGSAAAIRQQVNFPATYLDPGKGRLKVSRYATAGDLEGKITARQRGTSLARFVIGGAIPGKRGGVHVQVKPGSARYMKTAFAIRLRAGQQEAQGAEPNIGLAIRLKAGETIQNKKRQLIMMQRGRNSNLYLLYGPSVDQVFRSVREDMIPDAETYLSNEFLRQLELRS